MAVWICDGPWTHYYCISTTHSLELKQLVLLLEVIYLSHQVIEMFLLRCRVDVAEVVISGRIGKGRYGVTWIASGVMGVPNLMVGPILMERAYMVLVQWV